MREGERTSLSTRPRLSSSSMTRHAWSCASTSVLLRPQLLRTRPAHCDSSVPNPPLCVAFSQVASSSLARLPALLLDLFLRHSRTTGTRIGQSRPTNRAAASCTVISITGLKGGWKKDGRCVVRFVRARHSTTRRHSIARLTLICVLKDISLLLILGLMLRSFAFKTRRQRFMSSATSGPPLLTLDFSWACMVIEIASHHNDSTPIPFTPFTHFATMSRTHPAFLHHHRGQTLEGAAIKWRDGDSIRREGV